MLRAPAAQRVSNGCAAGAHAKSLDDLIDTRAAHQRRIDRSARRLTRLEAESDQSTIMTARMSPATCRVAARVLEGLSMNTCRRSFAATVGGHAWPARCVRPEARAHRLRQRRAHASADIRRPFSWRPVAKSRAPELLARAHVRISRSSSLVRSAARARPSATLETVGSTTIATLAR